METIIPKWVFVGAAVGTWQQNSPGDPLVSLDLIESVTPIRIITAAGGVFATSTLMAGDFTQLVAEDSHWMTLTTRAAYDAYCSSYSSCERAPA